MRTGFAARWRSPPQHSRPTACRSLSPVAATLWVHGAPERTHDVDLVVDRRQPFRRSLSRAGRAAGNHRPGRRRGQYRLIRRLAASGIGASRG